MYKNLVILYNTIKIFYYHLDKFNEIPTVFLSNQTPFTIYYLSIHNNSHKLYTQIVTAPVTFCKYLSIENQA